MPLLGRRLRPLCMSLLVMALSACDRGGSKATRKGGGEPSSRGVGSAGPQSPMTGPVPGEASGAVRGRVEALGPAQAGGQTPAGAAPSRSGSGTAFGPRIRTVFLILLENKVWSALKGNDDAPYLNGTLLARASIAEAYRPPHEGGLHPSEPNYVWLEAGDNLGITNDDDPRRNHRDTRDHLVTLLEKAGVSWRSYQEDIGGEACPLTPVAAYKPKHNPMVFFDDVTNTNDPASPRCIEHVRPLSELERDLSTGGVARYNFITPNECHDMHTSCEPLRNVVKQGDDWLGLFIPKILASPRYEDGGVIFITWDEAELRLPDCPFADCPVGLLALSPLAKGGGYTNHVPYDHGSLLRTVQEIFAVSPLLRGAATATDLSDLFTPSR